MAVSGGVGVVIQGNAGPVAAQLAAPQADGRAGLYPDPVFVLCNGRSGSTLLRFLLDAHPELACPPETNLPGLCVQLATVWSLIEGAPLSANRGDEPPDIPDAAIAGVRETMDRMLGSYLARRGKKRYCDKSLGTARFAPLLARVYPHARFICLYRHPMDVIASGAEACPWGLNGYGFDPYIAATPGNMVLALANFWADNVRGTLAAEEQFAAQSFRLRYEDLVADPETAAAALFEFLEVAPAPGISAACFSAERERFGPGDHKIWYTSAISADSVGRGWSVPAAMIAPQLLAVVNELNEKLGYLPVDGDWGTTEPPADLRVSDASAAGGATADGPTAEAPMAEGPMAEGPAADGATADGPAADGATADGPTAGGADAGPESAAADGDGQAPAAATQAAEKAADDTDEPPLSAPLAAVLRAGLRALAGENGSGPGGPPAGERFVAVALTKDGSRPAEYWLVDIDHATVTPAAKQAQDDSDWDVIGSWEIWERVIARKVNLSAAIRSCELRYCDNGETTGLTADARIGFIGRILGLASWQ